MSKDDHFSKHVSDLGLRGAPKVSGAREPFSEIEALEAEKVSDRRVPFTVERAADYITLPIYPGEREVTESHVQFLVDEMEKRRFNWDIVSLARCTLDGVTYKINGQHCSWGRLALPTEESPMVREMHYKASSLGQLKALYSSFDRAKARTDSHLTRVELVGATAVEGLWAATVTLMSQGIRFWKFEKQEDYKRVGPAELASIINNEHASLFNIVGLFFQTLGKDSMPVIRRQPVFGAMFATFDKVATVAPSFWVDIAEGTNLTKDDARWHLRRYLENSAIQRSGANNAKKIVSSEEMYRVCISAWNKWRASEKVQVLKPTIRRNKPI